MFDNFNDNPGMARDERRRHDRSRLIVDLFFDGSDATGVASTKDISAGGLYMNTQTVLPEGARIKLRIPVGGEQMIVLDARVVYSNPGLGVGVRFDGLSEKDRAAIERLGAGHYGGADVLSDVERRQPASIETALR